MKSTRRTSFVVPAAAALVAVAAGLCGATGLFGTASAAPQHLGQRVGPPRSALSTKLDGDSAPRVQTRDATPGKSGHAAASRAHRTPAASCHVSGGVRLCGIDQGILAYYGLRFPTGYSSDGEEANIAFARADARRLVNLFTVPAGAVVLHHSPAGADGCLAGLGPQAAGNEVAKRWWVTSLAPQTVIDDLDMHSPRGGFPNEMGSGGCPRDGYWYNVELDWPSIVNKASSRAVYVTATRLRDGKTGVLLESESDAVTLRSTSERVPAGVTRVKITTTQPVSSKAALKNPNYSHFKTEKATISKAATVKRIVNLANALPSIAGWGAASCTIELNSEAKTVTIGFDGAGGRRLALLSYTDYGAWGSSAPNGCQPVMLKIGGHWRSPLLDFYFVSKLRQLAPTRLF